MKFPKIKINLKSPIFWLNLVFVLFLLLAFYFRFYHFAITYDWSTDNIRDFLVSKHIVKYHDFEWISPWAAGGKNNLANSVFYFYFLSIFYLFSFGNILVYQLLVALLYLVLVLIYSYLLGKLLFKEKYLRYLTVLLFCFIPVINIYGRSVFQPHFVLPIILMIIYYLFTAFKISTFKKKSIKSLSLAAILYSIALNIHYSVLIFLPWIVGMTAYLQYVTSKNKKEKFKFKSFLMSQFNWPSLIFLFNFYFLFLNQIIIKGFKFGSFSIFSFFYKGFTSNFSIYLDNLVNNFDVFVKTLVGVDNPLFLLILFYLLVFFIFILFFLKNKTFYSISSFLTLLFFPFIFLITSSIPGLNYPNYYFVSFYILLPVFLISVLASLNIKWRIILFTTLFLTVFSLACFQFMKIKFVSNQYQIAKYKNISLEISNDAKQNLSDKKDFFLFTIDDQLNWSSPAYLFYIENYLDEKLVINTSYRYNLISLVEKSKNIYLICDDPRVGWNKNKENWCLERFAAKKIFKSSVKIFSIEEENLSVYRILLNDSIDRYSVYGIASKLY